jgi:hypothetical protein
MAREDEFLAVENGDGVRAVHLRRVRQKNAVESGERVVQVGHVAALGLVGETVAVHGRTVGVHVHSVTFFHFGKDASRTCW